MNYKQILNDWASKVENDLPMMCDECGNKLNQIRYVWERNREHIQLTNAVNEHDVFKAECPHCNKVLKKEVVSVVKIR